MFDSSKDPAFTLFGRKIPLHNDGEPPPIHSHGQDLSSDKESQAIEDQIVDEHESVDDSENLRNLETVQEADEETTKPNSEKTLKKPDKLLPCPRCKSMDSKFCYFNNYNVNQPRHFCKACQRYWTAGGTMRNVAVGAGRRKSKSSVSIYRQIKAPNETHNPKFISNNGRVLCFNLDAQNSEPLMGSVLNYAESSVLSNEVKQIEEKESDKSSLESPIHENNGFPSQISYLSGNPWPFVWNSSVHQPAIFPQGFPLSFYPVGPWFSPQVSSSTLGKHQRDNEIGKEEEFKQRNGCVLTPKALRFDDPSEAAKSSIWTTLGIKNESITSGKNLFKTFQSNGHEKAHGSQTSSVLQANPAALSRSLVFRESS